MEDLRSLKVKLEKRVETLQIYEENVSHKEREISSLRQERMHAQEASVLQKSKIDELNANLARTKEDYKALMQNHADAKTQLKVLQNEKVAITFL